MKVDIICKDGHQWDGGHVASFMESLTKLTAASPIRQGVRPLGYSLEWVFQS